MVKYMDCGIRNVCMKIRLLCTELRGDIRHNRGAECIAHGWTARERVLCLGEYCF